MKILALDLGDKWVGTAISDTLGLTCKPHQTVKLKETADFLKKTITDEEIKTIVVGYPKTSKGTQSAQTLRVVKQKEELEHQINKIFPGQIQWVLWDERLSSKRAEQILPKKIKSPKNKQQSHSVAAAFILQSYLDYLATQKSA